MDSRGEKERCDLTLDLMKLLSHRCRGQARPVRELKGAAARKRERRLRGGPAVKDPARPTAGTEVRSGRAAAAIELDVVVVPGCVGKKRERATQRVLGLVSVLWIPCRNRFVDAKPFPPLFLSLLINFGARHSSLNPLSQLGSIVLIRLPPKQKYDVIISLGPC